MPFYAVGKGRNPGIYETWSECENEVKKFSGARYKKFATLDEAQRFVQEHSEQQPQTPLRPGSTVNTDEKECPVVYTDGACLNNGRLGATAGIGVFWGPGHPLNVSEPLQGRQTNNRAEIHAACKAVQQAKDGGFRSVEIRTDSQFMIDSMTEWIKNWKSNDWKIADGTSVKNREDFEKLDEASQGIQVKYVHVRAHSGIKGNEEADSLANEGARKGGTST